MGKTDREVIESICAKRGIEYSTHSSSYSSTKAYTELRFGTPDSNQAQLRFTPDGELDLVEVY
jgi:hypothetical protein